MSPDSFQRGFGTVPTLLGVLRGIRSWTHFPDRMCTCAECLHLRSAPRPGQTELFGNWGRRQPWVPGENVAKCLAPTIDACTERDLPTEVGLDCQCGYYAYWGSPDWDHYASTSVVGVIEGYGAAVVGPAGFRCQKARIIALALPFTEKDVARMAMERETLLSWVADAARERRLDRFVEDHANLGGLARSFEVPLYTHVDGMLRDHPTDTCPDIREEP